MTSPPQIFDRPLYVARQAKARGKATEELDQLLAEEVLDRLVVISRSFEKTLLIAPRCEAIATVLQAAGKSASVECAALKNDDNLGLEPLRYDAVISLIDLQNINDVPGYLAQLTHALKPDGLAMLAFFAGDTLLELRDSWLAAETELNGGVSPRIAPMIDLREAGGLLQRAGLALPVADMQRLNLRYADPMALLREIKSAGFANVLHGRNTKFTSPHLLLQVAHHYQSNHADADGRIRATLEIAWATAWKPHPSQQQPLKPGSAKARLAEALKVDR
jgi:hypothetical protein